MSCWLYKHLRDYSIVHVHGLFSYTTLLACFVARHFGRPYVISSHGVLDPWCLGHKWWKKFFYYKLLESRNLQHSSAVHVTSSFEADGVARLGYAEKIKIIPLSVDLPSYRFQHQPKPNKVLLRLIFLSRLDPIKGLPVLFKAVSLLREYFNINVQLKIVGGGNDGYLSELQNATKKLNIFQYVEFVGFLQGEAKLQALADADNFIMPSQHENFSLSTAEAMAAGLPVIVSDQVGIAEDIAAANAGIVVPFDMPDLLAEAIIKYQNPEVRFTAGANARKLAETLYSRDRFEIALLKLYKNVFQ